jgi:replication initiation protein RepC
MQVIAATPFGRRAMTLAMLESQIEADGLDPDQSVDKWKIFRALCEARSVFGVGDRALAVLNALLSFHPEARLDASGGLVVFPSNAQLSIRAHGMAPATLRRHIADLVDAGLVIRRDSPNGKRYARKDAEGEIADAFGFSLAPLVARSAEIEAAAAEIRAEQAALRQIRERISLCRRDIAKLIGAGLDAGVPADWEGLHLEFRARVAAIPRRASLETLASLADELDMLRAEVLNILENMVNSRKTSASESQAERLIQNSNTNPHLESEPSFETKQEAPERKSRDGERVELPLEEEEGEGAPADGITGRAAEPAPGDIRRPPAGSGDRSGTGSARNPGAGLRPFPLGLVLQACPDIANYAPGGAIGNWRELMATATVVRSMLGVSPSAYEEACAVMGPENAATVMACILERAGHINSAGGYLRDLTRRAEQGAFAIGPMLMALAKSHAGTVRRTG